MVGVYVWMIKIIRFTKKLKMLGETNENNFDRIVCCFSSLVVVMNFCFRGGVVADQATISQSSKSASYPYL